MGFPFDEATWSVVEGAMFTGWGGSLPGLYTFLGIVACVVILIIGNRSEKERYRTYEQRKKD